MPNRNYEKGVRYERKVIEILKREYDVVEAYRSAGSHGPVDVYAHLRNGGVLMIQVKSDTASDRLERLMKLPSKYPNIKQLWHFTKGKGYQIKEVM